MCLCTRMFQKSKGEIILYVEIVMWDKQHNCPLLSKKVSIGVCYEVQAVRAKFMSRHIPGVPDFDEERADELCDECPYRQL